MVVPGTLGNVNAFDHAKDQFEEQYGYHAPLKVCTLNLEYGHVHNPEEAQSEVEKHQQNQQIDKTCSHLSVKVTMSYVFVLDPHLKNLRLPLE